MKQMLKKLLIVFLAVLLAVITPMQVIASGTSAEEDDEKVKYISELFLVNKENLSKYESNNAYLVYKTPIYKNTHSDKEKNPGTELYLVAELTTDAANAITDIKTMEMGGGYSFELFKQYLNEMRLESEEEAANLLEGPIAYFRDIYDNGENPTDAALSAYQLLNCFIDDDPDFVEKNGGQSMRLGDLFLDETLTADTLTDILYMGSTDTIRVIEKALAIACSENESGETFLNYISNFRFSQKVSGGKLGDPGRYKADAEALLASLNEFYEAYGVYQKYSKRYPGPEKSDIPEGYPKTVAEFDEELLKHDYGDPQNAEEFLENYLSYKIGTDYELFYKGKAYVELFGSTKFYTTAIPGPGSTYELTLLDLFTQQNYYDEDFAFDKSEPDDLLLEELEYFVIALIEQGSGQMLCIGLPELISIAASEKDAYQKKIAELKVVGNNATEDDKAVAQYAQSGISVFYGTDSDIFEKGMVAMTTAAEDANTNGDASWAERQQEMNETAQKARNIYLYSCIGTGALATVSLACAAAYVGYTLNNTMLLIETKTGVLSTAYSNPLKILYTNTWEGTTAAGSPGTFSVVRYSSANISKAGSSEQALKALGGVRSAGQIAAGITAGVVFVISVAALVFSLVMYLQDVSTEIVTDAYTEIPAIICDNVLHSFKDEETGEFRSESRYVYYRGVSNPALDVTESLYEITGKEEDLPDDVRSLPQNKGKVQDIYNWELYGNRKWCCLYTSKDSFVGIPIKADSLTFDANATAEGKVTVKSFNPNIGKSDLYKAFVECFVEMEREKAISDASKFTAGKSLYIHYEFDLNAAGAKDAGETFTGLLASIVTTPTGWGLMAGVLALGACGGVVIGNLTAKKKKKDDEGGKEE